ncbi:SKIP/SNW domain-containing protein [Besnoitia besnoiti]|uniref:SKIP/SNW domain-containing protein n=1 Tax=Besnoitia besnoiti TaxID=94643 RepID=A0A2A9MPC2_BESBE|nr:SKIP/SNW domain-containing protein [Besnoitia besnoiti]PFH38511.1 SKIP/SNW domain-containing protein [Besnoitia besnoiti]
MPVPASRRLPAPAAQSAQSSSSSSDLAVADASLGAFALTSTPQLPLAQRKARSAPGSSPSDERSVAGLQQGARRGGGAVGALAALAEERLSAYTRRGDRRGPPLYGQRKGFVPRTEEDFGGGGAFPEIHVAQFPLGLGRKKTGNNHAASTVALQLGSDGRIAYDLVVRQGSDKKVVYSTPQAAEGVDSTVPVATTSSGIQIVKRVGNAMPSTEEEEKEVARTKAALEAALEKKLGANKVKTKQDKASAEFFRYTPAQQGTGHNSGCAQRVLRVEDMQQDPMNPPKFRHKRAPAAAGSPPPPVMHSPPRKLTQQDQAEWKIPPSISNWKNQKGYTIPLDKRLQADGRNLQDVSINDKFASLSEALYIAERQAREEIRLRNEIKKQKKIKEEEMREQQLRLLAAQARAERSNLLQQQRREGAEGEEEERKKREAMARDRQREIEREMRLERNKRGRNEEERDVSERVALGLPPTKKAAAGEGIFDTRLFNQSAGVDSGFDGGNDEAYNLYDQPLFANRANSAAIYQFSRERLINSVGNTGDVPSFAGADRSSYSRTAPVEFEKDVADPFGLDNLLSEAKKK